MKVDKRERIIRGKMKFRALKRQIARADLIRYYAKLQGENK